MRTILSASLALVFVLALAPLAHGHRVSVFAYAEGDTIHTESGFGKNRPVTKGTLEVYDDTGKLLLSGPTAPDGTFSFPIPKEAREGRKDLTIVIQAGEGHKGEWQLTADEYLGPAGSETQSPAPEPEAAKAESAPVAASPGGGVCMDRAELTQVVEAAVDRKIAPLKRMLIETTQAGPGLVEIFGGLGWLLGLAGIAAYFKSKR